VALPSTTSAATTENDFKDIITITTTPLGPECYTVQVTMVLAGIDVQNMPRAIVARVLRKLTQPDCDTMAIDFQPTPINPSGRTRRRLNMAMKIKATLGYQTESQARAVGVSSFETLQTELATQDDAFRDAIVSTVEVVVNEKSIAYEPEVGTGDANSTVLRNIATIPEGPIQLSANVVDSNNDSDDSEAEEEAMSILVYVGCGIFILLLIIGFAMCCVYQEKKAKQEKALKLAKKSSRRFRKKSSRRFRNKSSSETPQITRTATTNSLVESDLIISTEASPSRESRLHESPSTASADSPNMSSDSCVSIIKSHEQPEDLRLNLETSPETEVGGRKSVTFEVAKLVNDTVQNVFDGGSESDSDANSTGVNSELDEDTLLV